MANRTPNSAPPGPDAKTRLACMPGIRSKTASALAAAALAAGIAACGGDDDGTIPRDQGERLLAQLDEIESAVDNGQCDVAQAVADSFAQDVDRLPEAVNGEVRGGLEEAGANLRDLADDPDQCEEPDISTTDIPPPTESEETVEPPVVPTEDEGQGPPEDPGDGGEEDGGEGRGPDGKGPPGQDDGSGGIGSD